MQSKKLLYIQNFSKSNKALLKIFDDYKIEYEVFDYRDLKDLEGIEKRFIGIVLSGTEIPVAENPEAYDAEIKIIQNTPLPIFGICGGMQLINQSYLGSLDKMLQSLKIFSSLKINHRESIFHGVGTDEIFFIKHSWKVKELSNQFLGIATDTEGQIIYGIRHKERPIYGLQFHPERTEAGKIIVRNFLNIVSENDNILGE